MSFRKLVEGDCGTPNPLMQFGNQIARDNTFKEDGLTGAPTAFHPGQRFQEDELVNEFLGQMAAPPQSFQMDTLLQEMREIENSNFQPQVMNAPRVIDEVNKVSDWANQFATRTEIPGKFHNNLNNFYEGASNVVNVQPVPEKVVWVKEFFDVNQKDFVANNISTADDLSNNYRAMYFADNHGPIKQSFVKANATSIFDEENAELESPMISQSWTEEYEKHKSQQEKNADDFNNKFWKRLEDEMIKMYDEKETSWLPEYDNYYDPYKEYSFASSNPMSEVLDALERGKTFLANGDIPSAVLCFEAVVQREPDNAEAWELLGLTQAENEMDPNAIAALKKTLELVPDNMRAWMALAVSYTNESLQIPALKALVSWLQCNEKYKHLVPEHLLQQTGSASASSLIRRPELGEIQNLFLEAVKQNPTQIDPDIQEALGVLYNLSSDYDKAADCFRTALHVSPDNYKIWNRLGASLANGNKSVEAVEAYTRSLQIQPGFIRARYNVGIICMNLKAYKEAAEHLLTALNLQANSTVRSGLTESIQANQMSDTIWSTLRMVLSLMGRRDLQPVLDARDLNALNLTFGES